MNDSQQSPTEANLLTLQPRFFVAPKLDDRLKEIIAQASNESLKRQKKDTKTMRYAAYVRISSDEQVGNYSIEAQTRAIQTWVQAQGGQLVRLYSDEAHSGRTAQRPAFLEMRLDARNGKFDALIVHKFDRFARNRTDALAIKSLLRYDYGIKVFSVTEPSEDSDGPIGALIEGIMESVAEWYSKNLGTEVAKGRKERHAQGYHNNNAPFGYTREGRMLVPASDEAPGVVLAFELAASGKQGYADIACILNERGFKSKSGRPFAKEAVRWILHNEIYIGKVKYQETRYSSQGKRDYTAPIEWFMGKHQPLITPDLFEQVQRAIEKKARHRQPPNKYNPYLLRGLVYCFYCATHSTPETNFPSWGKMHGHTQRNTFAYYRCCMKYSGFECPQRAVTARILDEQVIAVLSNLKPPAEWREKILSTISNILGERSLEERLKEIKDTIDRMDFRWDNGFITDKNEYLEKRLQLQQELEKLTPVREDLETAVSLLEHFPEHFAACDGDIERQHDLVRLIVERVYVEGEKVVAMTLKSDYHIVLGHEGEVDQGIHQWGRWELHTNVYTVKFIPPYTKFKPAT